MLNDLNDSLDDLIGARSDVARNAAPARPVPADFTPDRAFVEGCPKCGGSGQFRGWSGRAMGRCFACKGAGKFTFKTSPEARAHKRDSAEARKAKGVVEALAAFEAANPVAWAWLKANTEKFDFATKMVEAIARFGSLTENQLAACERLAAKDAARVAERAARAADAPAVDTAGIDRLKASFDQAVAYSAAKGLRLSPRITIAGVAISPAKANSKNPGALYVKRGGEYLGKIVGGRFHAVSACDAETQTKVLGFIADPQEAAKVYGQTTGTCCICNATLISKWKHRGIGPICAEKFGW